MSYFAYGIRVGQTTNPAKEHDRVALLHGRAVGALADGPPNPVVWRRDG